MDAQSLRARLVEIDDAVRALPDDAFADKHALRAEHDLRRTQLRTMLADELTAASDDWAERAGHKGEHSVDEGERSAAARLVTRGLTSEGAGGY